jgi:hypothetical protein
MKESASRRSRQTLGRRLRKSSDHTGTLAELDRLIDVRERLVHAIDELEAGEPGIDTCRALLEGLLEDFDHAYADKRG